MTTLTRRLGAMLAGKALAIGLAVAVIAGPATAATLSLNGTPTITAAEKRADQSLGLSLDKAAKVTFTFLSGDTSRVNKLAETSSGWNALFWSTTAVAGATSQAIVMGPGLLELRFNTRGARTGFSNHEAPNTRRSAMLYEIINGGKSAILSYDDGSGTFDALVTRIDLVAAQIPLPATGLLLLGGFGGLGLLSRRRRAA